jgi:hypothetical protein
MTNERDESNGEPCLMVRAEDGTAYAIPRSIVEAHRLSDEQRTELEAHYAADAADTGGFDLSSGGFVGPDYKRPAPLPYYNATAPNLGGWDGVGLRYVQPRPLKIGRVKLP